MNDITIDGWIARDENDRLFLYSDKPFKGVYRWCGNIITELNKNSFENIIFYDDNPTQVELKIDINITSTGE